MPIQVGMRNRWFYAVIVGCLLLLTWPPFLFGSPAPVDAIAVWLISAATVLGVIAGVAHILFTKGNLYRGFDWEHEADSALLRRGRLWGLLFGAGATAFGVGAILFGAWWYPRPDPRGIDVTPEDYAVGPMFVASIPLAIGVYLLVIILYRDARVRRILRKRRETAGSC